MVDPRSLGAQEMIVAVFRLAVCDIRGMAYGHDGPGRPRSVQSRHRRDASSFIASPWAAELADMAGIPIAEVRRRLRRSLDCETEVTANAHLDGGPISAHATAAVGAGAPPPDVAAFDDDVRRLLAG